MIRLSLAAAALALAACTATAGGEPPASGARAEAAPVPTGPTRAEVGHRLADKLCSRCHEVGATGDSPNPASPPFRVLASRYDQVTLGKKLDDIATGHYQMPPTKVTNDEIDSLVEYLESFNDAWKQGSAPH
ncbi:MAG TPA: cytochrome c [Caulobacteraceae bacterium]|nr:cytochrome c [Caulobacteraceae bacterium]